MDTPNNTMEYRVFCTHREGWHFVQAISAAKIEYYNTIHQLSEDLGLIYYKTNQPVSLVDTSPAVAGATTPTNSSAYLNYPYPRAESHEINAAAQALASQEARQDLLPTEEGVRSRSHNIEIPAIATPVGTPLSTPTTTTTSKKVL